MNQTAIILNVSYRFCEIIYGIDGKEYVLCKDPEGNKKICQKELWNHSIESGTSAVTTKSTAEQKIRLFLSYFRGREDVYARRWYNYKTKAAGYAPSCVNEWQSGLCDKRKYRCSECPNRKFNPLTSELLKVHLIGRDFYCRDVAGIYPLLQDDKTWLLCADFDDEGWKEDVKAFCEAANSYGLTPAVERSRSGNGGHVWFFFEEPVSAADARKLGSMLLTKAMEKRHELSFKSYDRLFPSQDTLPKGGFGNLIALPFQGQAQKNGNSLFVDDQWHPYPDQWAYLCTLPKINALQLNNLVSHISKTEDTGKLMESNEKPWERQVRKDRALGVADFPSMTHLVLADRLYIEKQGFSESALNRIKRMGAFRNPEFYKFQAMRLPIYNKPRVIDCTDETNQYLILPRGCYDALCDLFNSFFIPFTCDDLRNQGKTIQVEFDGQLRTEQIPAAEALLSHDQGVLSAATAFGKTVIGAYLISRKRTNTLILVHSTALLTQWKDALEKFLIIDEPLPNDPIRHSRKRKNNSPIGQLGAGKNTLTGIIDIAIIQSLFEGEDKHPKSLIADYGMVICDECHHVAAFSFEKALKEVRARYVYGLSATPTRQDGHHPIIFMQCGPIRYLVDAKKQAQLRVFDHYLIPRLTKTRLPDAQDIHSVYTGIIQNEMRNTMIKEDIINAIKDKRTPIVLTERKEHALILYNSLKDLTDHAFLLLGSDSVKEKREKMATLRSVPVNESLLIVATGKYVGEGFDEPRLDTLFIAMPFAWKGTLAQYVGRLHRNYEGKYNVRVYDYVDIHIPMLERMYQKRLKGYAELGYQTMATETDDTPDMIYTGSNYMDTFIKDIKNAGRTITISAPALSQTAIKSLIDVIPKKIKLTVLVKTSDEYTTEQQTRYIHAIKELEDNNAAIIYPEASLQNYAIIDDSIVWFGSISYLSRSKKDDTAIRLINPELAGELSEI